MNKYFFDELEKQAISVEALIRHKKPILGGIAALIALNILGPKLYTYFNEREKKGLMRDQKGLLENIDISNRIMATPKYEPPRDTYNYV